MPTTWLETIDESTVNFFVRSYQFSNTGSVFGDGEVSGVWADNSPFVVILHLPETGGHLTFTIVPEPASIVLTVMGLLGALVLRRRF